MSERGVSKEEMVSILSQKDIQNKLLNSFNEFLRFQDSLKNAGLKFEKTAKRFSKSSSAIYFPKRLIGRKFTVYLMPIDDGYEVSEPKEPSEKAMDKLVKGAEKDVEKIQNEDRKPLITKPNFAPIL